MAYEQFMHKGLRVSIELDSDPMDPREDGCFGTMVCWHKRYTLGDSHSHADSDAFFLSILPDELQTRMERLRDTLDDKAYRATEGMTIGGQDYRDQYDSARDAYLNRLHKEADKIAVILPLYLYDHSGITMSTGPFSCPWDSGQVGFIYADILKEHDEKAWTARVREKAEKILRSEVKEYDQFIRGDVYGYIVESRVPPAAPEYGYDDDSDDDSAWEEVESCWGMFGLDYCKEEAIRSAEAIAARVTESA